MPSYTNLKGITGPNEETLCAQLKTNIVEFFNWGLLGQGFFTNISGSVSGSRGGDYSSLRLVDDPRYTRGRVWEGARINWVWETGVENGYSPIEVSGVYVNNTFYPSNTTGTYKHSISYPLGRVIFDTAISATATVKCHHSAKRIQMVSEDEPWAKEVIFNTYRVDQASGTQVLGQNRLQLPSIVVGTVPNRNSYGLQLGGGHWVEQDVYFVICAETIWDRDRLMDIVSYQKDKTIYGFDLNEISTTNDFPLTHNGVPVSGAKSYPELVEEYPWKKIFFKDMRVSELRTQQPFFKAIVRGTLEVKMDEI